MGTRERLSTLDLGSVHLACTERGSGVPVVLVHGSNSDIGTWRPVMEPLGQRYRVVLYSRRHHWPHDPLPATADYAMRDHVDDLDRLMRTLGLAPAHLVGHSYGALVCLLLALRRPDAVRSMVLCEPPALRLFTSNTPTAPELLRLALTRPRTALAIVQFGLRGVAPARRALQRGDRETALRHMAVAVLGREGYRQLPTRRLEMARRNFIPAELTGSGLADLPADRLRQLRTPTLLLEGARSPALFHRLIDRLQELLPSTSRISVPHASHIVHEDNPAAWLTAVAPFLDRHTSPVGPAEAPPRAAALARMTG
jgi:pimeloyl-ACP methyl ester carboxylesterase